MIALITRDLKLIYRQGGGAIVAFTFFLSFITTLPFAIGADLKLLGQLAPALLWLGLLLSSLLGFERLFQDDKQDGSLDLLILSESTLVEIVLAKAIAHFIGFIVPLLALTPLMGLLVNMPLERLPTLLLTLLVGAPSLTLIGCMGAAIAVSFKRGGLLIATLILPLTMPVLIFGVAALKSETLLNPAFLILAGIFLLSLVFAPLLSALALKQALD
jgi:heme exporter protein B